MSTLTVYDMKGSTVGSFDVRPGLLVSDKGSQAVHDAVVAQLAKRRAGTASTLRKGEVAGSGAKPWRQKGTGRARAGYRQSPVWRGGSVAFGPHPRTYGGKVNKKVGRLALRRALSENIAAGNVRVLDDLVLDEARTRRFVEILKALNIDGPALFVVDRVSDNLALASRNVPKTEVVAACNLNVYQLLRYPTIVITRAGMQALDARLAPSASAETTEHALDGGAEAVAPVEPAGTPAGIEGEKAS